MRGLRAAALVGLLGLLGLLAAGSGGGDGSGGSGGGSRRIDPQEVERLLMERQLERQPALKVGHASCPSGIAALQGESFDCTVEVEGQPVRFRVTILEVVGGRVRYEMRQLVVVIDVGGVVNKVRSLLEGEWREARIDCGPARVRLLDVGMSVECTVSNGVRTRYIQAVVEDTDGAYALRER